MWLFVGILAFFFLAIASVSDKFILSKSKIVPVSYAFYVCALGGIVSSVLLLFNIGFTVPAGWDLWMALLGAGGGFYLAIYFNGANGYIFYLIFILAIVYGLFFFMR